MMGLEVELSAAAEALREAAEKQPLLRQGRSVLPVRSGCDLFLRYVTRCFLDFPEFEACKEMLLSRGEKFIEIGLKSRARIADLGQGFIRDGTVVFTHGYSRGVHELLLRAAKTGKNFSVVVSEGRPHGSGVKMAGGLAAEGIPVQIVLDAAMGHMIDTVDLVIVGAEGVMETGGVISQMGTYQLALVAKAMKRPFYVAAESYKFTRLFPLSQRDLPDNDPRPILDEKGQKQNLPRNVTMETPLSDYTPANYITLLFTDLGVLTPSAVSDELIRLYQ
eukprot:CAMPEP_0113939774 /NCGR_PEP_ID=MMETSP1339-20121228/6035_1 /TAXON_ID=94617 /ORGANISM="Fibrocapsa japonica" /LENGTH=276 /DNA_ID=CAMNT_0000943385 /DNA_START=163 /DNA_END=993 /DNA_ORIENTATION=+ /assembly_acc=CAM_ASM_000762